MIFNSGLNTVTNNSFNINGIIENYTIASGNNISAGDFVSYINNSKGKDTRLNDSYFGNYKPRAIEAVALTNNKVFIAYEEDGMGLKGMVCTIEGVTITTEID